jgi:hypothetical protein
MPDSMMYSQDYFVVLETNQPEQLLSLAELRDKLKTVLGDRQNDLPRDLQALSSLEQQINYLIDTCCDFDLGPGEFLQWYAVRLEKS